MVYGPTKLGLGPQQQQQQQQNITGIRLFFNFPFGFKSTFCGKMRKCCE